MKGKILTISFAFLLLMVTMIAPVLAKPFMKEVTTDFIDGPFPPDEPGSNVYGKGVMHQTLIVKDVKFVDGQPILEVIMEMIWDVRIYEMVPLSNGPEPGEFLFLLKMTRVYEGTIVPDVPGGGFQTGKLVENWVINKFADVPLPPDMDLRGHWVTLYEDGVAIKKLGFGVSPFQ